MTPELRELLTKKDNALVMMNLATQKARSVSADLNSTPDEVIAADIEMKLAADASYEADKVYWAAIQAQVKGEAA